MVEGPGEAPGLGVSSVPPPFTSLCSLSVDHEEVKEPGDISGDLNHTLKTTNIGEQKLAGWRFQYTHLIIAFSIVPKWNWRLEVQDEEGEVEWCQLLHHLSLSWRCWWFVETLLLKSDWDNPHLFPFASLSWLSWSSSRTDPSLLVRCSRLFIPFEEKRWNPKVCSQRRNLSCKASSEMMHKIELLSSPAVALW